MAKKELESRTVEGPSRSKKAPGMRSMPRTSTPVLLTTAMVALAVLAVEKKANAEPTELTELIETGARTLRPKVSPLLDQNNPEKKLPGHVRLSFTKDTPGDTGYDVHETICDIIMNPDGSFSFADPAGPAPVSGLSTPGTGMYEDKAIQTNTFGVAALNGKLHKYMWAEDGEDWTSSSELWLQGEDGCSGSLVTDIALAHDGEVWITLPVWSSAADRYFDRPIKRHIDTPNCTPFSSAETAPFAGLAQGEPTDYMSMTSVPDGSGGWTGFMSLRKFNPLRREVRRFAYGPDNTFIEQEPFTAFNRPGTGESAEAVNVTIIPVQHPDDPYCTTEYGLAVGNWNLGGDDVRVFMDAGPHIFEGETNCTSLPDGENGGAGDGISEDGDGNGNIGDNPCMNGETAACDDNCPDAVNALQHDGDGDGVGDLCDPVYGENMTSTLDFMPGGRLHSSVPVSTDAGGAPIIAPETEVRLTHDGTIEGEPQIVFEDVGEAAHYTVTVEVEEGSAVLDVDFWGGGSERIELDAVGNPEEAAGQVRGAVLGITGTVLTIRTGAVTYEVFDPCAGMECGDGIACTVDGCSEGTCTHTAENSVCDNGLACDGIEMCNTSAPGANVLTGCIDGEAITCALPEGMESACAAVGCNEETDACATEFVVGTCDDGNACTVDEACVDGVCTGGTVAPECVPDPCEGMVCNDGDACTVDSCVDGTCVTALITCEAESACVDGVCVTENPGDDDIGDDDSADDDATDDDSGDDDMDDDDVTDDDDTGDDDSSTCTSTGEGVFEYCGDDDDDAHADDDMEDDDVSDDDSGDDDVADDDDSDDDTEIADDDDDTEVKPPKEDPPGCNAGCSSVRGNTRNNMANALPFLMIGAGMAAMGANKRRGTGRSEKERVSVRGRGRRGS